MESPISKTSSRHVVIVGGGFGGLNAAKELANKSNIKVTLVDRRNYHLFQPLLYQVATAGLSPADIATPIRGIFSNAKNINVMLANVTGVELSANKIKTDARDLSYDYLILACGAKHSYFGHTEWEDFSPGLKTLEQATEIRRRILLVYEQAEKETDEQIKKDLLTFVIVGGGPTGVELAGAIGEIARYTLERDFRNVHPNQSRVLLVEAGPRVLASFSAKISEHATRDLGRLGVEVRTNSRVTNITPLGVWLGSEFIAARTAIWAAGVQPSSLNRLLSANLDPSGRVIVNSDLSLPEHSNVFVIGDQAHFEVKPNCALPGLAPVAIQEGRHAAKNILRQVAGEKTKRFVYLNKGQMATIGRRRAVVQAGPIQFDGILAWLTWLVVHIYYLIGFRNRVMVMLEWAWSYLTFQKGARLIMAGDWHSYPHARNSNEPQENKPKT